MNFRRQISYEHVHLYNHSVLRLGDRKGIRPVKSFALIIPKSDGSGGVGGISSLGCSSQKKLDCYISFLQTVCVPFSPTQEHQSTEG